MGNAGTRVAINHAFKYRVCRSSWVITTACEHKKIVMFMLIRTLGLSILRLRQSKLKQHPD